MESTININHNWIVIEANGVLISTHEKKPTNLPSSQTAIEYPTAFPVNQPRNIWTWNGNNLIASSDAFLVLNGANKSRQSILEYIDNNPNTCYAIYKFTTLDVLSKDAEPTIPPHGLDYTKQVNQHLYRKQTFDSMGLLVLVEYYSEIEVTVDEFGISTYHYDGIVLKVEIDYTMGDDFYVKQRSTTRTWYFLDGNPSPDVKVTTKVYTVPMARAEAKRRRENLVDLTIIETGGLIMMTENITNIADAEALGMSLVEDAVSEIEQYIKYGSRQNFLTKLSANTAEWLDNTVPNETFTIRDYIVNRLDLLDQLS